MIKATNIRKPHLKEKTGAQDVVSSGVTIWGNGFNFYVTDNDAKRSGTWAQKVRNMRIEPTISLLRILYVAPLVATGFSIEVDEDVPEELKEEMRTFAREQVECIWDTTIREAGFGCLDFGWQGFEKLFRLREDGRIVIRKIKPLLQEITTIEIYDDNGDWAGFQQSTTDKLSTSESMLFSWDVRGTNWYGRAPMKNLETAYDQKKKIETSAEGYDGQVASAHWIVYYPPGQNTVVENGVESLLDNKQIADKVLAHLRQSGDAAVPSEVRTFIEQLESEDGGQDGVSTWKVELLTAARAGGKSPYQSRLNYKDTEFARGLGFPERVVFEGEHGTKAEASEHTETAAVGFDDRSNSLATVLTSQLLCDLIEWNFGLQWRDTVRVKANPIQDCQLEMLSKLYDKLLSNSEIALSEYDRLGIEQITEQLKLPINETSPEDRIEEPYENQPEEPDDEPVRN